MISAFVKGQTLKLSQPKVVANSNNYLEVKFVFQTADWTGLAKWAHFTQGETVFDVLIDGDCMIKKDKHLNLSEGEWDVYLHGNDTDGTMRITTDVQKLTVQATGFICAPLPEIPLPAHEQTVALAAEAKKIAEEAKQTAIDSLPYAQRAEAAAKKAETSEQNAKTSETNAATSESSARQSASNAATSEQKAGTSEIYARQSAKKAIEEAGKAQTSATSAKEADESASTSAANAKLSETAASSSASSASASKKAAGLSETNAKASENAAKASQAAAKTSEDNSKVSETNASTSEKKAATSEANAKTSEGNASTSEQNAKTSEDNALTYATRAETAAKTVEGTVADVEQLKTEVMDITGDVAVLDADLSIAKKDIANSKQNIDTLDRRVTDLEHNANTFVEDSTEAYIKDVPAGSASSALLTEIGGKTYKSENLIPFPYYDMPSGTGSITKNGITFTVSPEGYVTANGTATGRAQFKLCNLDTTPGIYYYRGCPDGGSASTYWLRISGWPYAVTSREENYTVSSPEQVYPFLEIADGVTVNNIVYKPMISKTAELPFSKGFVGLRDTKCTEVKPLGANLIDLNSFAIQQNAKDLVISGESISFTKITERSTAGISLTLFLLKGKYYINGEVTQPDGRTGGYSVYDSEKGTFVINESSGEFKNNTFEIAESKLYDFVLYCNYSSPDGTKVTYRNVILKQGIEPLPYTPYIDLPSLLIPAEVQAQEDYGVGVGEYTNPIKFENDKTRRIHNAKKIENLGNENWIISGSANKTYAFITLNDLKINGLIECIIPSTFNSIYVSTQNEHIIYATFDENRFSTSDEIKSEMQGVQLAYQLDSNFITETDISQYFPNGGWLEVQGGGSIVFENEHKAPVPSTVNFMIPKPIPDPAPANEPAPINEPEPEPTANGGEQQ